MVEGNKRVLFVLTSHGALGSTGKPTGFHYEEITAPYWVFADSGYEVDIASIQGGQPPHDPKSLPENEDERPDSVRRFLQNDEARAKLTDSLAVDQVEAANYDAIYLPGGHGTMWDLPESASLARLISQTDRDGKVIGAVCHGPAGLLTATRADGAPLVKGRRMNAFTDDEERKAGLDSVVPFLLESRLREMGAHFEKSPPSEACVVVDGRLVTGQNPASAKSVGEKMLEVMQSHQQAGAA